MCGKFLAFSCLLLPLSLVAQKFTSTTYSSYGIGIFGGLDHPSFTGIGNVVAPVIDSTVLNYYNPASYSALGHGQPLFSTGISLQLSNFTENTNAFSQQVSGMNHLAFAVPFGKRFGFAFGLKPYSRTGYETVDKEGLGTDTIKYTYEGSGNTNQFFTGYSVQIIDHAKHKLHAGAHLSYVFGNSTHSQLASPTNVTSGGVSRRLYQIKSLNYDFGLSYINQMAHGRSLTLGTTFSPKQNLLAAKTQSLFSAADVDNEQSFLTISSLKENNTITVPQTFSIGFAYQYRPRADSSFNKLRIFQLRFFGEFRSTSWSQYRANFSNEIASTYKDGQHLSFGLEFAPHYNFMERGNSINYFYRMRYRAGFQSIKLPYSNLDEQLTDSGITFGLNFPILSQRSLSSLSLGVKLAKRGTSNSEALTERYMGIHFGITIAPGSYDKWFKKYKID